MSTTKKALAIAPALRDELKLRLSAPFGSPLTVGEITSDTDQSPLIKIGTGAVGAAGGLIKVRPTEWPTAQNIVGLPQTVYATHTIQFVREAGVAGNTLALTNRILAAIAVRGCKVELYEAPNGTAPDASQIIPANLKDTYEADVRYPLLAQQ